MTVIVYSYRDLEVWQEAMRLAHLVYDCTNLFPPIERYVLLTQVRRAALSIPGNIAEGRGRPIPGSFSVSYRTRAGRCRSWRHI
jgi:four helix bundle protein